MSSENNRSFLTSVSVDNQGIVNPVYQDDGARSNNVESSKNDDGGQSNNLRTSTGGFTPVNLSWHSLNVSAYPPRKLFGKRDKNLIPIIKNVSGQVECGHVLAILGASGAGKTTLLNVLTGRNLRNLVIDGEVYLNGRLCTIDTLKFCSAYVQQADLFSGVLTVREHLMYQAFLRTDSNFGEKQIKDKVDGILFELGLTKAADSRIGVPGVTKSISGGEMKRLAFASEILTDPAILFCDEPTSGLDSYMAQSVVNVLKSMAKSDRTIICTIHQPSSEVFEMFDELLLLAEGRVAFMGSSQEALNFFSGMNLRCPQNYNPADFYIQNLAIIPGQENTCREKVKMICDSFVDSEYGKRYSKKDNVGDQSSIQIMPQPNSNVYKRNIFEQFSILTQRVFLTNLREPLITSVRISQTIFVALLLGVVYFQQEYNQEGIMNINGALFIILSNITFVNAFSVVNTFCLELPIFVREHNNGLYAVGPYFLSRLMAELPYFILLPLLFISIDYYMINLFNDLQAFGVACLTLIIIANVSCGFGYFVSCVSKNVTMGLSIAPPFLIPLMLFGGLFINNKSASFLSWIKYLSWFYYGNEILVVNQWRGVDKIECDIPSNTTELSLNYQGTLPNITGCTYTGMGVIKRLNFNEDNLQTDFICLIILMVFFRVAAFIALSVRARLLR